MDTSVYLPQWLDDLIFKEMGAKYCPQYSNMTNIDDDKEKTLNYLGTYFPRSYAESYCIFSEYFKEHISQYVDKEELSIFDFGSGTGGEIIGLLTVMDEQLPNLKRVRIVALDGNQDSLLLYEEILAAYQHKTKIQINNSPAHIHINIYKLEVLNGLMQENFDIIISFKAICEFVTKKQFEERNAYKHIANFLMPKMKRNGVILFVDVTTYNDTSQEWLPKMMDKGLTEANCSVMYKNDGYNQTFHITHSSKSNDRSKVAWRMIKQ